jgi:cysteine desulfurase
MVYDQVLGSLDEIYLNGSLEHKIPHILNLSVPYVEGESLLMRMSDFSLASGSACTSQSLEASHVIRAMHPDDSDLAHSSIRVCFGRFTEEKDVLELIDAFKKNIIELRDLSPLWSMFKKGIDLKKIEWNTH